MDILDTLDAYFAKKMGEIRNSSDKTPFSFQRVVLNASDLAVARTDANPYKITFPFNGVLVKRSTPASLRVNLSVHSDSIGHIQNKLVLTKNDSIDLPVTVSKGFLTWDAQTDGIGLPVEQFRIELYFFLDAGFKSGQISTDLYSRSTEFDGDFWYPFGTVAMTDVAAAVSGGGSSIDRQTVRKTVIYNYGANTVYIGNSSVKKPSAGGNVGMPIFAGQTMVINGPPLTYGVCEVGLTSSLSVWGIGYQGDVIST